MAKKQDFLAEVSATPWWFGLLTGAVGAAIILIFGPFLLDNAPALAGQSLGTALRPLVVPGAVAFFLLCGLSAGRSWAAARHRANLLRTHTQLDQLRTMSWQDFERLVGEAFRTQGYRVTESGLGGADGGVDLVLHRDGQRTLVQCKRWANRSVGVTTVRELAGVLAHDDAVAAILVTTSIFSLEAKTFAANKPIILIDGEELLAMVPRPNAAQAPSTALTSTSTLVETTIPISEHTDAPACPRCAPMVRRTNKSTGQSFWGCSTFPSCRGTLEVA